MLKLNRISSHTWHTKWWGKFNSNNSSPQQNTCPLNPFDFFQNGPVSCNRKACVTSQRLLNHPTAWCPASLCTCWMLILIDHQLVMCRIKWFSHLHELPIASRWLQASKRLKWMIGWGWFGAHGEALRWCPFSRRFQLMPRCSMSP